MTLIPSLLVSRAHPEPSEEQLTERIEYDMDEQGLKVDLDRNWLKHYEPVKGCKEDFFEQIMDRLEKTWFELVRWVNIDQGHAQIL